MNVLLCVFVFVFAKAVDFDNYDINSKMRTKMDPPYFNEPVPFGHITREGFGDPYSPMKQPQDFLELRMRMPKDRKEALELLEKTKPQNLMFINPSIPAIFGRPSPKEEMLLNRYLNPDDETKNIKLKWYDLPTIQARNAMTPSKHQYIPKKKPMPGAHVLPLLPQIGKRPFFSKQSFQLTSERPAELTNWTTCDQFAVGAIFAPKDVVNLKWTPFFIWDNLEISNAVEHTFEYPTNKLVNEYHSKYGKMLNKTVDWSKTKLLMTGTSEALLIAADKRGLFDVIEKHDVPSVTSPDMKLPKVSLRMKIEDPYLVMTYCEHRLAMAMAVSGNEPTDPKEMTAEAATVKFVGTGRPIWRNYAVEKEMITAIKEAKIREDNDRVIVVNGPIGRPGPPGSWS